MLTKQISYNYKTTYTGSFLITRGWTNGTVSLQTGATKIRYNIRHIKSYTLDTKIEYSINIYDDVNI